MPKSGITIFAAETAGTFGLVVAATGSIVYDGMTSNLLGIGFVAGMHFVGLFCMIVLFGRYSMAHLNPAVTLGLAASGHIRMQIVPVYMAAQAAGAMAGSLFVLFVFGNHADLGANAPGPGYTVMQIFGAEVFATILLMGAVLYAAVRGNALAAGAMVGGVVALDVLLFASVSGASMNPMRSLAPAVLTGVHDHLWLYWTAPFLGAAIPGIILWLKKMYE